jgi:uncharacterized repeat protein (TIGR02543 family)
MHAIAFAMALTLATNAYSQTVTIYSSDDGINMAKTGEIWYSFAIANGTSSTEIGNKVIGEDSHGNPMYDVFSSEGYAYITGLKITQPNWDNFAAAVLVLDAEDNGNTYDLSQCTGGFKYSFRGDGHRFSVEYPIGVTFEGAMRSKEDDWTDVTVPVASFTRDPYDECSKDEECDEEYTGATVNLSKVNNFRWMVRLLSGVGNWSLTNGSLRIRNFECLGNLDLSSVPAIYKVTFNSDGGSSVVWQNVKSGALVLKPFAPTKRGYTFDGWFNGEEKFEFTTPITADLTLKAQWKEGDTDPIRQIANASNIFAYAKGNSIVLQNMPSNAKVEVYNLNGKPIPGKSLNPANRGSDISISVQTKGIYIVKISGAGVSQAPIRIVIK